MIKGVAQWPICVMDKNGVLLGVKIAVQTVFQHSNAQKQVSPANTICVKIDWAL